MVTWSAIANTAVSVLAGGLLWGIVALVVLGSYLVIVDLTWASPARGAIFFWVGFALLLFTLPVATYTAATVAHGLGGSAIIAWALLVAPACLMLLVLTSLLSWVGDCAFDYAPSGAGPCGQ